MSAKRRVLVQLDTDPQPNAFDSVVAVDSGAQVLLRYGGITPADVRDRVYGAIFTRGVEDLRFTAIFVGGSDVSAGEQVLGAVRDAFLGSLKVSVMPDSGGANTTAAAAVVAVSRHLDARRTGGLLAGRRAVVLGATGPVGRRVVRLLAQCGASVVAGSRSAERAAAVVADVAAAVPNADLAPHSTSDPEAVAGALAGAEIVVAAGGAGVRLLSEDVRRGCSSLRLAIDLNAVPPAGIEGVQISDAGEERDGLVVWGAIGVGEIKMKIQKACVASLFEQNDRVLDAEEIFDMARLLERRDH